MIESEIRILLQTIAIQTRKKYSAQLRELGLHIGQELALWFLWQQDGITQSQLRCKLGSEASTVSNMLRTLEGDGIVYRVLDETDHRVSKVFLTQKGKDLQGPITAIWTEHEETMLKDLPADELLLLRRMLTKIKDNLNK